MYNIAYKSETSLILYSSLMFLKLGVYLSVIPFESIFPQINCTFSIYVLKSPFSLCFIFLSLVMFLKTFVLFFSPFCCCSIAKSYLTLCNPTDCSIPDFPVLHYLPEFAQTHVHWVNDTIQLPHHLPPPSPPAFNLSQHQGLFQWTGSSHQMQSIGA